MDLLEIFEENNKRKEIEKEEDEKREIEREIREIKSEIILGEEKHETDNKDLLEKIKIKYKQNKENYYWVPFSREYHRYYFYYNKVNIKKIQDYIDNN